jgi:hypothetical protein
VKGSSPNFSRGMTSPIVISAVTWRLKAQSTGYHLWHCTLFHELNALRGIGLSHFRQHWHLTLSHDILGTLVCLHPSVHFSSFAAMLKLTSWKMRINASRRHPLGVPHICCWDLPLSQLRWLVDHFNKV